MPYQAPTKEQLLALPDAEKLARFNRFVEKTFSHVDGRDLLLLLHPRSSIDIHRRIDGRVIVYEGDWLSDLLWARDGVH